MRHFTGYEIVVRHAFAQMQYLFVFDCVRQTRVYNSTSLIYRISTGGKVCNRIHTGGPTTLPSPPTPRSPPPPLPRPAAIAEIPEGRFHLKRDPMNNAHNRDRYLFPLTNRTPLRTAIKLAPIFVVLMKLLFRQTVSSTCYDIRDHLQLYNFTRNKIRETLHQLRVDWSSCGLLRSRLSHAPNDLYCVLVLYSVYE